MNESTDFAAGHDRNAAKISALGHNRPYAADGVRHRVAKFIHMFSTRNFVEMRFSVVMTNHPRKDEFVAFMPSGEGAMWDRKPRSDVVQRSVAFGSSFQRIMKN